ncbi:hypothetical protein I204_03901 [Kwoniella mangroviensis CBS 8886]|nr:hypothetical protein I204_03901 [Kwoniella mangroviensis CBS 8886]
MFVQLILLTALVPSMGLIVTPIEGQNNKATSDSPAECRSFYADVYAETNSNIDSKSVIGEPPENQQALTEQIISYFAAGSTLPSRIFAAPTVEVKDTYQLWFEYCQPKSGVVKGIYQAHYGLVGNAGYWNVQADDYKTYSFAENAAANGWAALSYDRLGVGRSAHPDGTNTVQMPFEIQQSISIASAFREGKLGDIGKFETIIGIGHSYGPALLTGVSALSPSTFDAIVLTGFSNNVTEGPLGLSSFQSTIASVAYPERFAGYPNDYVITPSQTNDQIEFFHYPNYTQEALDSFTSGKGELPLGQQYSVEFPFTLNRENYTHPVLVITGEKDGVFCSADCYITSLDPPATQLDTTKVMFPSVNNFQTVVINDTAHGINSHKTAKEAYKRIFEFVDGLSLGVSE